MPHRNFTWRDRLRYRFENTLSRGTAAGNRDGRKLAF